MSSPLVRRILLATDFSECAARALDYAVFLAMSCAARLQVLYVLEGLPWMDPDSEGVCDTEQYRRLHELIQDVARRGVDVEGYYAVGIPSERINLAVEEFSTDMVVLGIHGRAGLDHFCLGRTAESVVRHAPCPVLTVRLVRERDRPQEKHRMLSRNIHRILVPMDFSPCSFASLNYAIEVAKHFDAAMSLLHVVEPVYYDLDLGLGFLKTEECCGRAHSECRLSELVEFVGSHGLSVYLSVRGGIPGDSIVACAREQGADLIVMGAQEHRARYRPMSGVREAVLRWAPCPVLTVKSARFRPGRCVWYRQVG